MAHPVTESKDESDRSLFHVKQFRDHTGETTDSEEFQGETAQTNRSTIQTQHSTSAPLTQHSTSTPRTQHSPSAPITVLSAVNQRSVRRDTKLGQHTGQYTTSGTPANTQIVRPPHPSTAAPVNDPAQRPFTTIPLVNPNIGTVAVPHQPMATPSTDPSTSPSRYNSKRSTKLRPYTAA